ncbi:MAG: hypothetical protein J7562_10085 [Agrobacterium tumefaciens]|nr:hypothetical protein [Agrobacterium tumefaciens]
MNEHLRGGRAVLLDFEARPGLGKLVEGWKDRPVYLAVDAEGRLGLSAVLVRTDAIVAWVGSGVFDEAEFVGVVSSWPGASR